MRRTVGRALALLSRERRYRWAGLVVLAVVASLFEAAGAGLVLLMLRALGDPDAPVELPLVGEVTELLPRLAGVETVGTLAIAITLFFLLRACVLMGQSYLQARVVQNTGAWLGQRLLHGYLAMPYEQFLRRNSAELIRNVHTSIDEIISSTFMPLIRVVSETIMVLAIVGVLLATDPLATVLALAGMGPVILLLLRFVQPRIARLGYQSHEYSMSMLQALHQSLGGLRDIRLLGREPFFEKAFARTRGGIARTRYQRQLLQEVPRVGTETALVLAVALFVLGGALVREPGADQLAVLGLFGYGALRIMPALNRIARNITDLRFAAPPVDAVHEDLERFEARDEEQRAREGSETAETAWGFADIIELRRVSYSYPETSTPALQDVDLTIRAGEHVGIVGSTGAGKSTLVDVVLGLLQPSAGTLEVDGVDVSRRPAAWWARLGVVPQSVYLLDDTLRRNIALGLPDREIDEEALQRAVEMAQLRDFVANLPSGLNTQVGERGVRVSGGERQRVAIARALYRDPDVIVLDEGTSALDNTTERALVKALSGLRVNRTIITVAHRLSTVVACDRVIFMERGRIQDVGSYQQLVERSPAFREMAGHAR